MNLPDEVRVRISNHLWAKADEIGWSRLSDSERASYYERWTRDPAIGGKLAHYMDPRKVRVYIKDSLLKPYQRTRVSKTVHQVLRLLGIEDARGAIESYIKPHGYRLKDGRLISWGNSRDWKLILMAMHERAFKSSGSRAFGVVLLETGKSTDSTTREMIRDASGKLGIQRLEWLD